MSDGPNHYLEGIFLSENINMIGFFYQSKSLSPGSYYTVVGLDDKPKFGFRVSEEGHLFSQYSVAKDKHRNDKIVIKNSNRQKGSYIEDDQPCIDGFGKNGMLKQGSWFLNHMFFQPDVKKQTDLIGLDLGLRSRPMVQDFVFQVIRGLRLETLTHRTLINYTMILQTVLLL